MEDPEKHLQEPSALLQQLQRRYEALSAEHRSAEMQPDPRHPALRLGAETVSQMLRPANDAGPALSSKNISDVVDELGWDAEQRRAAALAAYTGDCDSENNRTLLKNMFLRLTRDNRGKKISVKDYEKAIQNIFGIVLTGHPTFSKHPERSAALAHYYSHLAGSNHHGLDTREVLQQAAKREYTPPTLGSEWQQALAALKNTHAAIDVVEDMAIEVAIKEYPGTWTTINYTPVTAATWLYYDWDGRKDITWRQLMENRLHLQELMLDDYGPRLEALQAMLAGCNAGNVENVIEKFRHTRNIVNGERQFYGAYNPDQDPELKELTSRYAQFMATKPSRITHPQETVSVLQGILDKTTDPALQKELVKLRSRLENHGLSYAQPHFRISSKSVQAALAEKTGINIGDDEASDNTYAQKIENLIAGVKPETSNIVNVAQSKPTIIKQMTLIRQIVDDLDSHCPIRFLVAETHNATTIKAALYFSRWLGVDNHINISPLFEDRDGGERAGKIMGILYKSPAYREHVDAERPHNPLQRAVFYENGYSDSGRYDGQLPAGSFIERNNMRILNAHDDPQHGLRARRLVRFDTHGHFMGRGMHPGGVRATQQYLFTGKFLEEAGHKQIKLTLEQSFQGEGGFLMLGTQEAALANLTQTLSYLTGRFAGAGKDIYYGASQREALAFFEQIRSAHSAITQDPDYIKTIGLFEGLIPPSGSRPASGQYDTGERKNLPRAIRHNGTNAQLGSLTNILYGVGAAIRHDESAYVNLARNSEEFRKTRLAFVVKALALSDPGIHESYVELYNPRFWLERARHSADENEKNSCVRVAEYLTEFGYYPELSSISDALRADIQRTADLHEKEGLDNHPDFQTPAMQVSLTQKANMAITHGVRIAAIIQLFLQAVKIPDISSRNDISAKEMVRKIMRFDPKAFETLEAIFNGGAAKEIHFSAKPSGLAEGTDYSHLRESLIRPMKESMAIISRAAHAVSDYMLGIG